jgi:aliphatic nitrilase
MIDELCDTPEKLPLIHAGGGHAVIFGLDGSRLLRSFRRLKKAFYTQPSISARSELPRMRPIRQGHYARPDVLRLACRWKAGPLSGSLERLSA